MSVHRGARVAWALAFAVPVLVAANTPVRVGPATAVARNDAPVVVSGASLTELVGRSIAEIALFRFDPDSGGFVPIPFQIDERVDHLFNAGSPYEFVEKTYDVFHEDDGLLDADDELAFQFGDGESQAPANAIWLAGADPVRYEIGALDPRPGSGERRWVYIFTGPSLPRSPVGYLTWNLAATGSIASDRFELDYADRWLLTGYRVLPPCGSGADLIDRLKGRAVEEDEETWNETSIYLGGIVGPIRAIRYVQGAASGFNTIHYDVVYRALWERTFHLRVHPIPNVSVYIDFLPAPAGTAVFTPLVRSGVPLDGLPDSGVTSQFVEWSVVRHPNGGMFTIYDVPLSPLFESRGFHYRDDASYNDISPRNPGYSDEDDSAYGDIGTILVGLTDSVNGGPISATWHVYPLCAGVGDATLGDGMAEFETYPFETPVATQTRSVGPVRTLTARREGVDVVLAWQPVDGATSYVVYGSQWPDRPQASWTELGETAATTYRDPGAASSGVPGFYSVVARSTGGPGPW